MLLHCVVMSLDLQLTAQFVEHRLRALICLCFGQIHQKFDDRRQVLVFEAGDCILRHHAVVHVGSFVVGREARWRPRSPAAATTPFPSATSPILSTLFVW